MKPTTNIYILADNSYFSLRNRERLKNLFICYERILRFAKSKAKLHFIRYNDKATYFNPDKYLNAYGNPNLTEGLKLLRTTIEYQRKYEPCQTRSIFLLFTSGNAMFGWKQALSSLYSTKEFTTGLRYVITTQNKNQFLPFTDRADRLLPYFSETRLLTLVDSVKQNTRL